MAPPPELRHAPGISGPKSKVNLSNRASYEINSELTCHLVDQLEWFSQLNACSAPAQALEVFFFLISV